MTERPDAGETATRRSLDVTTLVKKTALAAGATLGVLVFMVGVRIVDRPDGLTLAYTWDRLALWVAVVTVAGFLLELRRQLKGPPRAARRWQWLADRAAARMTALVRPLTALGLVLTLALPIVYADNGRALDISTTILIYIMLGWGLNIVVGLAGLLVLGYAAFYAVGAYTYGLLAFYHGFSFWMSLPLAGLFAAAFGVLLGFPVLRLRGDYLAVVTLGFGEIVRIVLLNWTNFTQGPNGISGIPRPSFFGLVFSANPQGGASAFHTFFGLDYSPKQRVIFLYYVIVVLALLTNVFIWRMRKLPLGRSWEALREDEIACRSLGINPTTGKLTAFALGAMFGGFAGAFFATKQGFVSPESFTFIESAVMLAIVVLGGMGSQIGVVIAAVLLMGAFELFRDFAQYRMEALGAAMVLIMIWRPRGLLGYRTPTLLLGSRKPAIPTTEPDSGAGAAAGAGAPRVEEATG